MTGKAGCWYRERNGLPALLKRRQPLHCRQMWSCQTTKKAFSIFTLQQIQSDSYLIFGDMSPFTAVRRVPIER